MRNLLLSLTLPVVAKQSPTTAPSSRSRYYVDSYTFLYPLQHPPPLAMTTDIDVLVAGLAMRPMKTTASWYSKVFSNISPEYHVVKGNGYLHGSLELLLQYKHVIPRKLLRSLVLGWLGSVTHFHLPSHQPLMNLLMKASRAWHAPQCRKCSPWGGGMPRLEADH